MAGDLMLKIMTLGKAKPAAPKKKDDTVKILDMLESTPPVKPAEAQDEEEIEREDEEVGDDEDQAAQSDERWERFKGRQKQRQLHK